MAVRSVIVNNTAGGIGKSNGFLHSLVAERFLFVCFFLGVGGRDQRPTVSLTEHMKGGARSSLFAALFFPDSKKASISTAAIKRNRYFQSPADRSRLRTRNLMYYNRASLST